MPALSSFLIGASIAGTATNIITGIAAGSARADAAERDAQMKQEQANELISRQRINEGIIREQGEDLAHIYGSAAASSGLEGTGIGGILKIRRNIDIQIQNTRRDVEFKAKMMREGASNDMTLASDYRNSSILTGVGSALSSTANIYDYYRKYKSPSSYYDESPGTDLGGKSIANYMTKG